MIVIMTDLCVIWNPKTQFSPKPHKNTSCFAGYDGNGRCEMYTFTFFFQEIPATVDGMLGGFSHISTIDIAWSRKFLLQFLVRKKSALQIFMLIPCYNIISIASCMDF